MQDYSWGSVNTSVSACGDTNGDGGKPVSSTTFYATLKTQNTIPSSMLSAVDKSTVQSQFEALLNNRKITEDDLKGRFVSVRTVQALIDTIVSFIVARYSIWTNPAGTSSMVFYDSGSVSYPSINYNYEITDVKDKVDLAAFSEILGSIFVSALSAVKVSRETFNASYSSSSSSSSCSSSCSSSSCSSSCSSSIFIAYMSLH